LGGNRPLTFDKGSLGGENTRAGSWGPKGGSTRGMLNGWKTRIAQNPAGSDKKKNRWQTVIQKGPKKPLNNRCGIGDYSAQPWFAGKHTRLGGGVWEARGAKKADGRGSVIGRPVPR